MKTAIVYIDMDSVTVALYHDGADKAPTIEQEFHPPDSYRDLTRMLGQLAYNGYNIKFPEELTQKPSFRNETQANQPKLRTLSRRRR